MPQLSLPANGTDGKHVAEDYADELRNAALGVGTALMDLLSSMKEGVVPTELHLSVAKAGSRDEAFEVHSTFSSMLGYQDFVGLLATRQQILAQLPSVHANVCKIIPIPLSS